MSASRAAIVARIDPPPPDPGIDHGPYSCRLILVIDNYDSFTWNLVQALGMLSAGRQAIRVARNDEVRVVDIERMRPTHVVISPGPCGPREAGVSVEVIRAMAGRAPILGVCLGHQCIAAAFGMRVRRHARPMHGKSSRVFHDRRGVFAGLPSPIVAARYHSLAVEEASVPAGWQVSARTTEPDGTRVVMGLRQNGPGASIEGVQFHPESFLTPRGTEMLRNFLADTER